VLTKYLFDCFFSGLPAEANGAAAATAPNSTDVGAAAPPVLAPVIAAAAASSVPPPVQAPVVEFIPSATVESPVPAPAPALPPVAHSAQLDPAPVPPSEGGMKTSEHGDDHDDVVSAAEWPAHAHAATDAASPHEQLHLHFDPDSVSEKVQAPLEQSEGVMAPPTRRTTRAAAATQAAPPPLIAVSATASPAAASSSSVQPQRSTAKAAAIRTKNKRSRTDSGSDASDSESDASSDSSMDGSSSSSSSSDESSAPDSTPPRRRATGRVQAAKKPMIHAPADELKSTVVPFDVEAFRSQTERVEDGYSISLPLADEFHFETGNLATHPVVVAFSQHQAVVITPAAKHTKRLQLDPAVLIPSTFQQASSMTLGCGNNNGVMVSSGSLEKEKQNGVWQPVPTDRAVIDFIDTDWQALAARRLPPPVPALMSNRPYIKDESEQIDFSGEARKQQPFFPRQQGQLQQLLQKLPSEPADPSQWGTKKEFTTRRRWLRELFQQLQDVRAEQKTKKNSFCADSFIHPLFLNELQLHRQSLINLSPVAFEGVSSYYLYLKVGFQFFNLVRQTTSALVQRKRTLHPLAEC
jgi:hypothetical protein